MSDTAPQSKEQRMADQAPEMHNDEQDDHRSQAQEVAEQALAITSETGSPTDSVKPKNSSGLMDDSTQDLVDHMKDMESSGRIDMHAYDGEPNHDDRAGKYGAGHDAEHEGDDS